MLFNIVIDNYSEDVMKSTASLRAELSEKQRIDILALIANQSEFNKEIGPNVNQLCKVITLLGNITDFDTVEERNEYKIALFLNKIAL